MWVDSHRRKQEAAAAKLTKRAAAERDKAAKKAQREALTWTKGNKDAAEYITPILDTDLMQVGTMASPHSDRPTHICEIRPAPPPEVLVG